MDRRYSFSHRVFSNVSRNILFDLLFVLYLTVCSRYYIYIVSPVLTSPCCEHPFPSTGKALTESFSRLLFQERVNVPHFILSFPCRWTFTLYFFNFLTKGNSTINILYMSSQLVIIFPSSGITLLTLTNSAVIRSKSVCIFSFQNLLIECNSSHFFLSK